MATDLDFESKVFEKKVIEVGGRKESIVVGGRDLFPLLPKAFEGIEQGTAIVSPCEQADGCSSNAAHGRFPDQALEFIATIHEQGRAIVVLAPGLLNCRQLTDGHRLHVDAAK